MFGSPSRTSLGGLGALLLLAVAGCSPQSRGGDEVDVTLDLRTCLGSDGRLPDGTPSRCRERLDAVSDAACLVVVSGSDVHHIPAVWAAGELRPAPGVEPVVPASPGDRMRVELVFLRAGAGVACTAEGVLPGAACDDASGCVLRLAQELTVEPDGSAVVTFGAGDGPGCATEWAADLAPNPGACDGVDHDCDGVADEDFPTLGQACDNGRSGECFAAGVTVCVDGAPRCDAGDGSPADELCDDLDNDCDGSADEGVADCCVPGTEEQCGRGVGLCVFGQRICEADEPQAPQGRWSACLGPDGGPLVLPVPETCDGRDEDCDGRSDEGFDVGEACTVGSGRCLGRGQVTCQPDGSAACDVDAAEPSPEVCNGEDDDCDGQVDEGGLGEACYTGPDGTEGVGQCAAGQRMCSQGSLRECVTQTLPAAEACEGTDEDCDGRVDEDFADLGAPCTIGLGVCEADGQMVCAADGSRTRCGAAPGAGGDEVCDQLDNDCDGRVDEGIDAIGQPCALDGRVGVCAVGETRCVGGAVTCVELEEPLGPAMETCDLRDVDCDGAIDEGCVAQCRDGAPDLIRDTQCGNRQVQGTEGECAEIELHFIGVHEALPEDGPIDITLARRGVPMVVVLTAYRATTWRLHVEDGVELEQVIVNGYDAHQIEGVPAGTELTNLSGGGGRLTTSGYCWPPSVEDRCRSDELVDAAEALTDLTLTSFTGCYVSSGFALGAD